MQKQLRNIILLAAVAALTSCESLSALQAPKPTDNTTQAGSTSNSGTAQNAPSSGVTLSGTVQAPAGMSAVPLKTAFGAPLANRQLLDVGQSPLANTEVFLSDAAGIPIPGIASVQTDAKGKYSFANVPPDFTFMVAARAKNAAGKDLTLQTLVKPDAFGANADVDAASTLVTAGVINGQAGALGDFNADTFKAATQATAKQLQTSDLPDLSDRAAVLSHIGKLAGTASELKGALEQIKHDMKSIKHDLQDLQKRVAESTPVT